MVLNATSVDNSEIEAIEPLRQPEPKHDVRLSIIRQSVHAEVLNDSNEESATENKPLSVKEKLTASACISI
mgnify:CR=1 FL=1